jgi:hypothetical protein
MYLGDDVSAFEAAVVPYHGTQPVRLEDTPKLLDVLHVLTQRATMVLIHPDMEEAAGLAGADRFGDHVPCRSPVAVPAL